MYENSSTTVERVEIQMHYITFLLRTELFG